MVSAGEGLWNPVLGKCVVSGGCKVSPALFPPVKLCPSSQLPGSSKAMAAVSGAEWLEHTTLPTWWPAATLRLPSSSRHLWSQRSAPLLEGHGEGWREPAATWDLGHLASWPTVTAGSSFWSAGKPESARIEMRNLHIVPVPRLVNNGTMGATMEDRLSWLVCWLLPSTWNLPTHFAHFVVLMSSLSSLASLTPALMMVWHHLNEDEDVRREVSISNKKTIVQSRETDTLWSGIDFYLLNKKEYLCGRAGGVSGKITQGRTVSLVSRILGRLLGLIDRVMVDCAALLHDK